MSPRFPNIIAQSALAEPHSVDAPEIQMTVDSLHRVLEGSDRQIIDHLVSSYVKNEVSYSFLPRILQIADRHHGVFRTSGLANALESNINNRLGAPGLYLELQLFDVLELSPYRRAPTLIRSQLDDQEVDVFAQMFAGMNLVFEAKMARSRGNQSQFHRLIHVAQRIGAKLVYVSAARSVQDEGILSFAHLTTLLDTGHPEEIRAKFDRVHETNLSVFENDNRETHHKPNPVCRVKNRIQAFQIARSRLVNRENRDNAALLDNQLRILSDEDLISLWNWIANDPELADQRFQLLYEDGLAELIVEDFSRELLKSVLMS